MCWWDDIDHHRHGVMIAAPRRPRHGIGPFSLLVNSGNTGGAQAHFELWTVKVTP